MSLTLPTDSKIRKLVPMNDGLLKYFPAALAGVANTSFKGNNTHNPGQPLHHARGKSADHADCVIRHLTDVNDILATIERANDADDVEIHWLKQQLLAEASSLAWRALALSQELHEKYGDAPMAPGAK